MSDTNYFGKLTAATIASCKCGTKTNAAEFHDESCRYRVLIEARDEIERLRKSNTELQQALNSTAKIVEGIRNGQVNVDMANEIERLTARVDELNAESDEFNTLLILCSGLLAGNNTVDDIRKYLSHRLSTKQEGEG